MDSRILPHLIKGPTEFTFADSVHLAPAEIAELPIVNVSVYLGRVSALRYALERLSTDNAQHEEYLSDIVNILGASGRKVRALQVSDPKQVLGYNNPAELLAVEEAFRASSNMLTRQTGVLCRSPLAERAEHGYRKPTACSTASGAPFWRFTAVRLTIGRKTQGVPGTAPGSRAVFGRRRARCAGALSGKS